MQNWIELFLSELKNTSLVEFTAVIFGVFQVLLAKANSIYTFPAGIVSTSISLILLLNVGLYAESALNVYYLVMSVYGWVLWSTNASKPLLPITKTHNKQWMFTLSIVVLSWGILYAVLKYFTPSTVPFWDAAVSSFAWAGMWLMAKRKLENWLLLNISNLLAIPLFWHKKLPMFALLTAFLFIVACLAYFDWKRKLKQQRAPLS